MLPLQQGEMGRRCRSRWFGLCSHLELPSPPCATLHGEIGHLSSPVHHQLKSCSPFAEAQDIAWTHSDGCVLDLAAVDEGAMGGVEVLKAEAVVRGSEFEGCVMLGYTCGLATKRQAEKPARMQLCFGY